jgi:Transposase
LRFSRNTEGFLGVSYSGTEQCSRRERRCRWWRGSPGSRRNQLFTWRRLYAEGVLSAVGARVEVVAASEYRALQQQVRELQRLLVKKTLENEIRREALDLAQPKNRLLPARSSARGDTP